MENRNPWNVVNSSKARLVTVTPKAEESIAYIARVTSKDQENPNIKGLLKYCAKHGHFSVFEQASMTVEVVTPLAISIQALRHRSFTFQQFSGRYENQEAMADHTEGLSTVFEDMFYLPEKARLQDNKNRQNSILVEDEELTVKMQSLFKKTYAVSLESYKELLNLGIAKEIARFALPEGVYTRLYITGNVRSFVHYLKVRDDEGVAQQEHCELAQAVKKIFQEQFPTVYDAFFTEEQPPEKKGVIQKINQFIKENFFNK